MGREILHRNPGVGKGLEHRFCDHAGAATHIKDLDRGITGKRHRRNQARDDRSPLALAPGIPRQPVAHVVGGLPMMVMVIAMMMVVMIVAVMMVVAMVVVIMIVTMMMVMIVMMV